MANVDSKLHNDGDALDRASETPKKSLRGAAGGVFIGSRATPNRTTDYVDGAGAGVGTSSTRPTGRTMYRGNGVQGGSAVGFPAKRASNHTTTFDKRSTATDGGRSLGGDGRGTMGGSVGPSIATPTLQGDETGFAVDIVEVVDGGSAIDADVHANTVTKYASGSLEVLVYERGTDTDEDGAFVGKGDWTLSDTQSEAFGAVAGPAALTTGTYAVYVRFVDANGNVGPLSNRFALAIA